MTADIRETTGQLAAKIFADILPHDDTLDLPFHRRGDLPQELRIPRLTADTDLRPGDVLAIREFTGQDGRARLTTVTAREFITRFSGRLAIVESVTDKTVTVRPLRHPQGGWGVDLADLVSNTHDFTERIKRESGQREIGVLGPIAALQSDVETHPDFPAWTSLYPQAVAAQKAVEREVEERQQAALRETAPIRDAVKLLTGVFGEQVADVYAHTGVRCYLRDDWEWLAKGGEVYLYGLAHLGRLPQEQLPAASAALELVLRYARKS